MTLLKSASKDDNIFIGWYKSKDCSGIAITSLGAADYTDNISLYAKWLNEEECNKTHGVIPIYDSESGIVTYGMYPHT